MNDFLIRELKADDLPWLARLYKQFWGEDSDTERMRKTFESLRRAPSYVFLVAESRGQLVGTVRGVVCSSLYGNCQPFMVVDDVIVDADWRRQGIASRLLWSLEQLAISSDCESINFVTERERTGAQRFYSSMGYALEAYVGFKKRL